jgi:multiple sugar transport system ATP-binding protein
MVQQVGTPLDLYDRPANLFVAGFIGSPAMNMISGWYRRDAVAAWIDLSEGLILPLQAALHHKSGEAVADATEITIGIRPEHIMLHDDPAGLDGFVELVEPTGFGTILHLRFCGTSLKAFTLERGTVALGERLAVHLPQEKLHLFDTASGQRLT